MSEQESLIWMIGKRVEIHPRFDLWMKGDRFGAVLRIAKTRQVVVQMDKSGKVVRFYPTDIEVIS